MDMITTDEVIRHIEGYFAGGANRYLTPHNKHFAERAITKSLKGPRFETTINLGNVVNALEQAANQARLFSLRRTVEQGVVLFAANRIEMIEVLACARVLRNLGSDSPIECHFATKPPCRLSTALRRIGVTARILRGGNESPAPFTRAELQLRAITDSSFCKALVLEPGTFPLIAPKKIFGTAPFGKAPIVFPRGAIFNARRGVWKLCGLPTPRYSANAQIVLIDRKRCSSVLSLWRWIAERAYFFTGYLDGSGGAPQLALAKLSHPARLSSGLAKHFWTSSSETPPPKLVRDELRAVGRLFS